MVEEKGKPKIASYLEVKSFWIPKNLIWRLRKQNCTTSGMKMGMSWKVGVAESWFEAEKNCGCFEGEGALVTERGVIEREWMQVFVQEVFPKTIDWKKERGWLLQFFISSRKESLKFWKSALLPGSCLAGLVVLWWRRRQRPKSRQQGLRIPWIPRGETVPLLGVNLGVAAWPLWGQKNW